MVVVASFTTSTNAPIPREVVTFTDTSTGSPATWAWDFGDGETSSEQHPEHAYAAPGCYIVTLAAGGISVSQYVTFVSRCADADSLYVERLHKRVMRRKYG